MSEGLEAIQHEYDGSEAPSDDDLIAELTEKIDAVDETADTSAEANKAKREEYAAKVSELDAVPEPEVEVKGERAAPITEEEVAGEKAGQVAEPDSALLKSLQTLLDDEDKAPAEPVLSPETQALQRLAELQEMQLRGVTPKDLAARQNTPEAIAQRAAAEAQKAQQEAAQLRQEIAERERERKIELLEKQIQDYATSKGDAYPLVNDGNQNLVSAAMFQSLQEGKPMSEDQALAHVEGKLREYVERSAARLGWVAPGAQSNDGNSGKANTTAESTITKEREPAPSRTKKSWDQMSDEERDAALVNLL